jgi:hypothetical protein
LVYFLLRRPSRRFFTTLLGTGILCSIASFALLASADNPPLTDVVGAIDGDAISVEGPMSVEAAHGQVRTVLRSGSDVHVKSGQAHIDLVEGGQIVICGPAHFSVLKSGKLLTLALDSGTIHAHIESDLAVTVYTPQIQAHAISIGNGPQDVLVGLDSAGAMCIRANKGAVRIEQQLTGQSVLVPQNGDVSLVNGQLETLSAAAGHCLCELQQSAKPVPPATEVSQLATPEDIKRRATERKAATAPGPTSPAPAQSQEPVYQVFMPPLQYDASAKMQADYDPNLVILVRRVRVRPTLIVQGRVEGDPVVAQVASPTPPPNPPSSHRKTLRGIAYEISFTTCYLQAPDSTGLPEGRV